MTQTVVVGSVVGSTPHLIPAAGAGAGAGAGDIAIAVEDGEEGEVRTVDPGDYMNEWLNSAGVDQFDERAFGSGTGYSWGALSDYERFARLKAVGGIPAHIIATPPDDDPVASETASRPPVSEPTPDECDWDDVFARIATFICFSCVVLPFLGGFIAMWWAASNAGMPDPYRSQARTADPLRGR